MWVEMVNVVFSLVSVARYSNSLGRVSRFFISPRLNSFLICWFAVLDALSWFYYLASFYGSCTNSIVCFSLEQNWSF
jgi:hypothetical protein